MIVTAQPFEGRVIYSSAAPEADDGADLTRVTTTVGNAVWPATSLALYVPMVVRAPVVIAKLLMQGGTSSGSFDLGVYDRVGTRLVSSGSTLMSGTNVTQQVTLSTPLTLDRGLFYLACAVNNTTAAPGRFSGVITASLATPMLRSLGLRQQASAFPLPANATFAAPGQDYIPSIAMTTRTLV